MKHFFKHIHVKSGLLILLTLFISISCKKEYKFTWDAPEKIKVDQKLHFKIEEDNNLPIEKIEYKLDGKILKGNTDIDISHERLGKHALQAEVFFNSKSKIFTKIITFYAALPPQVYDYKVINIYPHNTDAYTQGLEFHNGFLYESTGGYGTSSLRKVELTTGKILLKKDVPADYFAEGMTIVNNRIFQLTWRESMGFMYNISDFNQVGTFNYKKSKEGWGLTHDGHKIIKTDGTEKVWFLDPVTQNEMGFIEAYTDTQSVTDLNELEFINGKIYANVYQKNIILILNPLNGAIEGIADLNALEAELKKTQNLVAFDEVLNGIAYDQKNNRIFVTGKRWSKLYEIQLIKRN